MRIAFHTLGCKVNQYETQILIQYFSDEGFDIVQIDDQADVYVINSCTVTSVGDKKTRQIINKLKRQNPDSIVALTGCMPQALPEDAKKLENIDVITGAYNRAGLVKAVKSALETGEKVFDISKHVKGESFEDMQVRGFVGKSRAFVKIQDGCERYCSYCIIPKARGFFRSKPLDSIKQEIESLAKQGFLEVVLVGINLSCYGIDNNSNLIEAVEIACKTDGIKRVRLSSLEPELLTLDYIKKLSTFDNFCPQFHLSLQSGCDATLKRMNRHYSTSEYMEIVQNIRNTFENSAITTDIMTGFPGETDEEFEETAKFVQNLGLAKAHIFAYSRRKGTKADNLPDQIPQEIKIKRSKILSNITNESRNSFILSQKGKYLKVLFETYKDGVYHGYSENYIPVEVTCSNPDLIGTIQEIKIMDTNPNACISKI